ncbi:molybdate ABC transporter substrate-binding protein [Erwinia tracheiphila]|uniref:Molybdate transporter n=1 Tax=Erwinia tracheiphila TaxID=65700 RepID=A0A0M2K825_9GAMM|nr:molybdate ABC transporter substrate-binding protein [Erwinia tracheiphila]EOS96396.1 molybdate transporter periplasmic protein [Erwinia tracheiphila PSU-1]KKF35084.1 molybdate transporter [Erwinia tracheiphila]UIA86745.1 molybdate ABC transporter substrate-binding protein [Erwinia tracheiphila]UIA95101.1 molybdate ABC transporter substrate-binding protein [Erwinia tracheiphila]
MSVKLHHFVLCTAIGACAVMQVSAADNITVFAAASLTNALDNIADQYQKGKDVKVVSSFASSSTLARQIEQGAPADLFISADQQWMDYVADKKSIDPASRVTLLGNDLVLVAPAAVPTLKVTISASTDWKSLLKGERLSVGDPDHVPAGIYAKEALQKLGAWSELEPVLARGNSVRAALALVERSETPYGIVYGSDALASKKVTVVGVFPENSHKPVEYSMAMTGKQHTAAVTAFYHYLQGPEAAAVFKRYGFTPKL